ncbi:MAG TPA: cyclodeaminase/cyclohydrolase family protein [Vicinamibacterales bacterium]|nr:cyclodeaminase/cyclohydrolase family protein [Vicinamibacterales bacterium]
MALTDLSTKDLLNAFSSSDPTPGGGSAAALSSAIGASVLMMVCGLPKTKSNSDEDRSKLQAAAIALTRYRQQLTEAIDADTNAYDQVVVAYKLPRSTDDEKRLRKEAVQRAMRAATDVPLQVMRLSADALKESTIVAAHGHSGASSDVGVAIALLKAGLEGARLNVDINVGSIDDGSYVSAVRAEVERLTTG